MRLPTLAIVFAAVVCAAPGADPLTLRLWPEGPPGAMQPPSEDTRKQIGAPKAGRVSDVAVPTITVFRPEKPNGTAVIVAPGGGYMFLTIENEGTKVCEWLNSIGVTGVLLKYRTPTRDDQEPEKLPVQDGQRALGLVRRHAAEWGVNPQRVGFLGFSAGANLAGHVGWSTGPRTYEQKPDTDDPRPPAFLVVIYGGTGGSVPGGAPPAFFLAAQDDRYKTPPAEAVRLYLEYQKQNIPAELHVFAKGGHGFGMRRDKNPISDWPQLCAAWMQSMGYLNPK